MYGCTIFSFRVKLVNKTFYKAGTKMKTAIVTDSTAYIPKHIRDELNIYMIPLNVVFGTESYQEEAEISADDFYVKVREQEELPKLLNQQSESLLSYMKNYLRIMMQLLAFIFQVELVVHIKRQRQLDKW